MIPWPPLDPGPSDTTPDPVYITRVTSSGFASVPRPDPDALTPEEEEGKLAAELSAEKKRKHTQARGWGRARGSGRKPAKWGSRAPTKRRGAR